MRAIVKRKTVESAQHGRRSILQDLDFSMEQGDLLFVSGPSGAGKTTMLAILAGLDQTFEGVITGRPEQLSMMFQEARLLPWLSVRKNLQVATRAAKDEIATMLRAVGLSGYAGAMPCELSFGMARRVALVRALIGTPRLVLLDEPFASLDAALALDMMELIRGFVARGGAAVVAVHEADAWARSADKVISLPIRIEPAAAASE